MNALEEQFTLSNGVRMPMLGFGTWQIPDGSPAYDAISAELRHLVGALWMVGNGRLSVEDFSQYLHGELKEQRPWKKQIRGASIS